LHEKKHDKCHDLRWPASGFIVLHIYNMECPFEWYYFCSGCCFLPLFSLGRFPL